MKSSGRIGGRGFQKPMSSQTNECKAYIPSILMPGKCIICYRPEDLHTQGAHRPVSRSYKSHGPEHDAAVDKVVEELRTAKAKAHHLSYALTFERDIPRAPAASNGANHPLDSVIESVIQKATARVEARREARIEAHKLMMLSKEEKPMSIEFEHYDEARIYAQKRANEINMSFGIEKNDQIPGCGPWFVSALPPAARRYGWELSCEVVDPEPPVDHHEQLMEAKAELSGNTLSQERKEIREHFASIAAADAEVVTSMSSTKTEEKPLTDEEAVKQIPEWPDKPTVEIMIERVLPPQSINEQRAAKKLAPLDGEYGNVKVSPREMICQATMDGAHVQQTERGRIIIAWQGKPDPADFIDALRQSGALQNLGDLSHLPLGVLDVLFQNGCTPLEKGKRGGEGAFGYYIPLDPDLSKASIREAILIGDAWKTDETDIAGMEGPSDASGPTVKVLFKRVQ